MVTSNLMNPETASRTLSRRSRAGALGRHRRFLREYSIGYTFVLPFVIVFVVFILFPNIASLKLSFQEYKGFGTARWVGFENYKALLTYHVFWQELANTLFYWFLHAVILMPLAFFLAQLTREPFLKLTSLWRPLIFLPQVVNVVAITLTFKIIFSTHSGLVNSVLGITVPWLDNPAMTRWVVVALLVWEGLGFWYIVFLAGLSTLNPNVDEAAQIDGAGRVRRTMSITIPMIRPLLLFAFIFDAIGSITLYTEPNVLAGSGASLADPAVATVSNLVVSNLSGASFGLSAAAGWLIFIFTLIVSALIALTYKLTGGNPHW